MEAYDVDASTVYALSLLAATVQYSLPKSSVTCASLSTWCIKDKYFKLVVNELPKVNYIQKMADNLLAGQPDHFFPRRMHG